MFTKTNPSKDTSKNPSKDTSKNTSTNAPQNKPFQKGKKPFNKNGKNKRSNQPKKPLKLRPFDSRIDFQSYINHQSVKEARALLAFFGSRFNMVEPTPLSVGIKKEMVAHARAKGWSFSHSQINFALATYTRNPRYTECYKIGAYRVDMNGKPTTIITEDDIVRANKAAIERLKNLRKRSEARKAHAKRVEEDAKKRQEKSA